MAFYLSVFPYFNSYLQVAQGYSVAAAGHITNTFTFTSTVTAVLISLVIKYTHHYKYFITLGACIYMLGLGLMIKYRSFGATTGNIVGTQICIGIGGGMLNVPAQLGVQATSSHSEVAAVTAVYLASVEIGGAVGSAISGAVWSANMPGKIAKYLPAADKAKALTIYGSLTEQLAYPMGSPARMGIDRAYQETMHILLIIAVCVAAPLIPLSLLMRNYELGKVRIAPPPFCCPQC